MRAPEGIVSATVLALAIEVAVEVGEGGFAFRVGVEVEKGGFANTKTQPSPNFPSNPQRPEGGDLIIGACG